ncbi:hypothetical protein ABEF95_001040 [Exophiala dermatitidis]
MPDTDEKVLLHQDFWRHRRNCVKCSGRVKPTSWAWQNSVCPLEHLVKRDIKVVPVDSPNGNNPAQQAKPPSPKKIKDEAEADARRIAEGKIKVTYEIDDDFDAAETGRTGLKRTIWIQDFSMVEFTMQTVVKVEEEDDSILEEITISVI